MPYQVLPGFYESGMRSIPLAWKPQDEFEFSSDNDECWGSQNSEDRAEWRRTHPKLSKADKTRLEQAKREKEYLEAEQRKREQLQMTKKFLETIPPEHGDCEYEMDEPVCKLCLQPFRKRFGLYRHIRNIHKMQCPLCPENNRTVYPSFEMLDIHFTGHTLAEREVLKTYAFPCQHGTCKNVFHTKAALMQHRRRRDTFCAGKLEEFQCKTCLMQFPSKRDLDQHETRRHGRGKPRHHGCPFCVTKMFAYQSGLNRHLKKYHPLCSMCGDRVVNLQALSKHKDERHSAFSCHDCFFTMHFPDQAALDAHNKEHHD